MKNFLLCISISLICLNSKAQIWVQPNAVWHYDFSTGNSGGFIKVEHIKDTLLDSKVAKMFLSTKYEFAYDMNNVLYLLDNSIIDSNYTWNNSDTVFYWDNDQFEILYSFTNVTGDSWRIGTGGDLFNGCSDTSTVKILSEGLINLNGTDYTFYDLFSHDSCDVKLRGTYNSRFGCHSETYGHYNFVFPLKSWCGDPGLDDTPLYKFKCFQDDGLTYNPSGEDCEYLLNNVGIEESNYYKPNIYPNPSDGKITIESTSNFTELIVYNSLGILCQTYPLDGLNNTVELNLESGIYFLQVRNNNEFKTLNFIIVK